MYFQPIYHFIISCVYLGLAVWEIVTASIFTDVYAVDDVARCFTITVSIVNIGLGLTSTYIAFIQCCKEKRPEKLVLNATTGISLWGIILCFRFPSIYDPYRQILVAETSFFFTRIALTIILMFGSCIKPIELDSNTVEMNTE